MKAILKFNFVFGILALELLIGYRAQAQKNPWEEIKKPITSPAGPQSVGYYSLGCLLNGEAIAISNSSWEAVNTYRNRFYGHPELNLFLDHLGNETLKKFQKKIVIGDLGLPAGGPTASGHASHQTGLDVDVRFRFYPANKRMPDEERSKFAAPDIAFHEVQVTGSGATKKYKLSTGLVGGKLEKIIAESLKIAAEHPKSQRIFVSPPIKKEMCKLYGPSAANGTYPEWLRKISPYFGHADHYHVRIECPTGSAECLKQAPVAIDPTDKTRVGCAGDNLNWWYSTSRTEDSFFKKSVDEIENPPPPEPPSWIEKVCRLPEKCRSLVTLDPGHCRTSPLALPENPEVGN